MDFSTDTFIFGKERKMIDREAQKFSHQFRTEKTDISALVSLQPLPRRASPFC